MPTASIAGRLWMWAALLRLLKRFVPLETLVRLMHRRPLRARGAAASVRTQSNLESYMTMCGRFPLRPPANCLERSLGAYRLLCGTSADPELVIGIRRSGAHELDGHVWVTIDGRPLAERQEQLKDYVPVVTFDSGAQRHTVGVAHTAVKSTLFR